MEIMIIRGRDRSREIIFRKIMAVTELEVQAIVDQGQDSEPVPIWTG